MHATKQLAAVSSVLALIGGWAAAAQDADVLKAQAERVAVVDKVAPAVVAIFARGGQGGGSGVLISDDGYALSNFHVVQGSGPVMQCGLADGVLYDAVLVGLDKVGDVALIKLYPQKPGQKFPFAPIGDSDQVHEGDWSLAMGNPFLLATDFRPTVTFGMVSGVHRYQYPAGTLLEYTDCIQIDTSINPGNSGGPLFNMKGELIGINGRGSFDKRGRVNSGVGYAISVNQIKNFMGHMAAGLDVDHASLGATVRTDPQQTGFSRMLVQQILEDSDVYRRGLDLDDEILSFAGRQMTSVNHFKNALGLYPRGWRVPLEFRRERKRHETLVRLMGVQRKELRDADNPDGPPPGPPPPPPPGPPGKKQMPPPKGPPSPVQKYFQPKSGFANYYFNKQQQDRLLVDFKKHGDFSGLAGTWIIDGAVTFKKARSESPARVEISEEKTKDGKSTEGLARLRVGDFPYELAPMRLQDPAVLKTPEGSGGALSAFFLYHSLLTRGDKDFNEFAHGGHEPFYPPPAEGKMPQGVAELRVDCEVLNTRQGPYLSKWFFARADQKLLGFEVRLIDNEDPCEVYLSDYRPVNGRQLPHRWQVIYGSGHYGSFTFRSFQLAAN